MFTSMHEIVDGDDLCDGPRMGIPKVKAVDQQHVNCLVNTWVCVGLNMTVNSLRQGFLYNTVLHVCLKSNFTYLQY